MNLKFAVGAVTAEKSLWWWWGGGVGWTRPVLGFSLSQAEQQEQQQLIMDFDTPFSKS